MRIGVDLLGYDSSYSGGVATFAIGITKGLARTVQSPDSVVVLVSDKNEAHLRSILEDVPVSFKKITVSSGRRYVMGFLKYLSWAIRNFRLAFWYEKYFRSSASKEIEASIDAVVVPTTTLGFFALRLPSILCVHDIQQEYYPEFFSLRERLSRGVSYRLSCWAATSIQVSSLFVKGCIVEKFPFISPEKIFVAYEGVDFEKFTLLGKTERPSAIDSIEGKSFVFYPAQLWKHKNHMMLIEALAIFRDENDYELPCVLTGQDYGYWETLHDRIKEFQLKQIYCLGRVSFEQLLWLYQNCKAVLALGLHESSSLPVREGAVFGKPLICSNIPPNVETQAFLSLNLVDCHDPKTLAKELYRVADGQDEVLKYGLQNIDQVRVFDWNLIAKEYLSVVAQWRRSGAAIDQNQKRKRDQR